MDNVKLAIIYYSATGTNQQLAEWAEKAAEDAGATVRRRKVSETAPREAIEANDAWKRYVDSHQDEDEVSLDDLEWADAIIFSTPTRYGNLPSQLQSFIDTTGGLWAQGKLINKVVSGFTSAMNPHGGQEGTLHSLYKTMMHWGAIIVPHGYTSDEVFASGGNPYGVSATADQSGNIKNDGVQAAVEKQVERVLDITSSYLNGRDS